MASHLAVLFTRCRLALGETQVGLGAKLGVARRTSQRWAAQGVPTYHLPKLAALVYPRDAKLAAEVAAAAGTTLERLGLVASTPVAPPAAPAAPPTPPTAMVDAVVCAAADALNVLPRDARPGVYAAFARAAEIGTSIEFVTRVLAANLKGQPAGAGDKKKT